jgi:cytochrome c-type biogenesis protein CcmH
MSWLLAGALVALPAAVFAADAEHPAQMPASEAGEDFAEYVEGAQRLEGRIMAPCCWMQTIDIHGSPAASELRTEIRRRLKAGESADAIEASLVQRFGPKILAVQDSSPLGGLATGLALAFGGAGVAGYFMLKRWSRAGKATTTRQQKQAEKDAGSQAKDDALDERLDRELSEIGGQP